MKDLFIEYSSKVIVGCVVLCVRYIEKSMIVKHYRDKFDKYLDEKFMDDQDL